ncbi:alpha/beta hydrolase family protein [Streptomyces sp. NRRL F-5650]|uniref:alpha/beta hydrolase family protein n=1 Tax=Streptomyces sp. NRRL F-5650 TaxID=1463868 RepID=UPI000A4B5E78|nr:prolyl oligopeptidase family serine peptidase [Streptomyces sp. NRRL F-5650]
MTSCRCRRSHAWCTVFTALHAVSAGIVDAARVGLMGGSYGGFMSSWLVTQDTLFTARSPSPPSPTGTASP